MDLLITNAKIITPAIVYPHGWLLTRNGTIAALGGGDAPNFEQAQRIDAHGKLVLPGFIDVHVHGGNGYDAMDAAAESLHQMARFYARHGVTSFLATTWTDAHERITASLQATQAVMQTPIPNGATIVGVHLEGPYLNPAKCGAQNINYIRRAEREEALSYLDFGIIRLLSLAPEYEENHWLIRECVQRGITVSTAHTGANYEQTKRGIELGITHATHTYNAMTGLHHRDPGTLGAVMESPYVRCEIIADTVHVHPTAVDILWRVKGDKRLILITDAIRAAGMPDGDYQVDERTFTVRDGVAKLPDGTLSGSVLTFDKGMRNFLRITGAPIERVWQIASLNPAESAAISHRKGSIEIGKDADLIIVDDEITVETTIIMGQIAYQKA
jgi:N-acetylglucosamine-6-phosphate deacetylase